MESASEEMNFERAAVLRDQLHAVQSVQQRQNIVSKEGDFDVVGMSRLDEHAGLEIFYIRYGKMVGKENLSIPDSLHETDEDIIAAFIKNFTVRIHLLYRRKSYCRFCRRNHCF